MLSGVRKLLTARLVLLQPAYSSSMRGTKWIRIGPATEGAALEMLIRLGGSRRSRPVLSNAQVMESPLEEREVSLRDVRVPQFAAAESI